MLRPEPEQLSLPTVRLPYTHTFNFGSILAIYRLNNRGRWVSDDQGVRFGCGESGTSGEA